MFHAILMSADVSFMLQFIPQGKGSQYSMDQWLMDLKTILLVIVE
jgi:hypothetical protein